MSFMRYYHYYYYYHDDDDDRSLVIHVCAYQSIRGVLSDLSPNYVVGGVVGEL